METRTLKAGSSAEQLSLWQWLANWHLCREQTPKDELKTRLRDPSYTAHRHSITFRALGTAVGSLLREHISSTQSRSAGITRIARARSHQAAT